MATAVSGGSNHAAPDHFRDRAKLGGITGQSPLISTEDNAVNAALDPAWEPVLEPPQEITTITHGVAVNGARRTDDCGFW
jgi:hypothetical protein